MKESHKIGHAFGYVYDYGEYPAGHVFDDEFIKQGKLLVSNNAIPYEWIFLAGNVSFTPSSGPVVVAHRRSLGTALGLQSGDYSVRADSDCRLICFSGLTNASMTPVIPSVTEQHIAQGEVATLVAGTKFLVCDGSLQINGKAVGALQAGRAVTGDITVSATSDAILILFR
jgi:hypothetical protein